MTSSPGLAYKLDLWVILGTLALFEGRIDKCMAPLNQEGNKGLKRVGSWHRDEDYATILFGSCCIRRAWVLVGMKDGFHFRPRALILSIILAFRAKKVLRSDEITTY